MRRHARASFAGSTKGSGMRRGLLGLVCLCVLGLAAFLGSSAPSAGAAACPNEAFRGGPSANLPDCRAYEMVTPANMEGQEPFPRPNVTTPPPTVSPDGETVIWSAFDSFGEAESSGANSIFLSARGADWSTESISPPLDPFPFLAATFPQGFTEGLDKYVVQAGLEPPLTAGASTNSPNMYVRNNTDRSYQLVSVGLPADLVKVSVTSAPAASADAGHVVLVSPEELAGDCGAPAKKSYLCDWNAATGTVSLIGRAPVTDEVLTTSAVSLAGPHYRHSVSADGSRIFFKGGGEGCGVCVRINGATTHIVTETGAFQIASTDGSVAYVTEGEDLKRYDVAADELSAAIAGEVQGVLGASADGSRVYFVSKEEIGGSGTPGENNLYLWTQGAGFKFVATGDIGSSGNSRVTPDGMHLAFQMDEEVYLYSAASGELACASCKPSGEPATQPSYIISGPAIVYGRLPRNLSDDGRYLFFTTDEAKVPRDTNNLGDVYVYDAARGELGLISPGTDVCGAVCGNVPENTNNPFGDASASGNDVFFITREPLVPTDVDTEIIDIYNARVNGGLASQNPPPEQPPCTGQGCRGETSTPSLAGAASAGFVGKGNISAKQNCNKLGREAKKLSKRAKRLRKNAKKVKKAGNASRAKKLNKKSNRLSKQARNKSKSAKKCRKRNKGASK